ncbi:hypothetical protein WKH56_20540 [Priestia sp. SB1]|uniref:hypothetical protein n=1 Tax=Priestia sp. SB1 TaxID=3132359 RepID=UPI00317A9093
MTIQLTVGLTNVENATILSDRLTQEIYGYDESWYDLTTPEQKDVVNELYRYIDRNEIEINSDLLSLVKSNNILHYILSSRS